MDRTRQFLSDASFFLAFLIVAMVFWMREYAQGIVFTLGFAAIVIGCAIESVSLAFIVGGSLVCGLMVMARLLAIYAQLCQETKGGAGDA